MYHYAANNPVKYTDPDGRKIYSVNNEEDNSWKSLSKSCYIAAGLIAVGTGAAIFFTGGAATAILPVAGELITASLLAGVTANAIGNESNNGKAQDCIANRLKSSASFASPSPMPPNGNNNDDDNDEPPNFKDKDQIAKKFGNSNTKEFENSTKKDILKDAGKLGDEGNKGLKNFLRENKNPDIGVDKKGNIWLKSRINGSVVDTNLPYTLYAQ